MFGIKSKKRIKELETKIKILESNWELDVKKLHGTYYVFRDFSRQQLVDWIIKIESEFNKVVKDKEFLIKESLDYKTTIEQLEEINNNYKKEIETLKARLSKKKK